MGINQPNGYFFICSWLKSYSIFIIIYLNSENKIILIFLTISYPALLTGQICLKYIKKNIFFSISSVFRIRASTYFAFKLFETICVQCLLKYISIKRSLQKQSAKLNLKTQYRYDSALIKQSIIFLKWHDIFTRNNIKHKNAFDVTLYSSSSSFRGFNTRTLTKNGMKIQYDA